MYNVIIYRLCSKLCMLEFICMYQFGYDVYWYMYEL